MDPITLALTFLLQHPNVAASGVEQITRPGTVDVAQMTASFADLSRGILNCYHRTARYQVADVIQKPWGRQTQYGAENSAVIRIRYFGVSNSPYVMIVAVLGKEKLIRTAVLQDNAMVPYSKNCALEQWKGL